MLNVICFKTQCLPLKPRHYYLCYQTNFSTNQSLLSQFQLFETPKVRIFRNMQKPTAAAIKWHFKVFIFTAKFDPRPQFLDAKKSWLWYVFNPCMCKIYVCEHNIQGKFKCWMAYFNLQHTSQYIPVLKI